MLRKLIGWPEGFRENYKKVKGEDLSDGDVVIVQARSSRPKEDESNSVFFRAIVGICRVLRREMILISAPDQEFPLEPKWPSKWTFVSLVEDSADYQIWQRADRPDAFYYQIWQQEDNHNAFVCGVHER